MDLTRTPAAIADAAAEEIRALNHKTLPPGQFEFPSNIYDTASALMTLAQRLPQAILQLERALQAHVEAGTVRTDDGSDLDDRVAKAAHSLETARAIAGSLGVVLDTAVQPLARLAFVAPPGWDDNEDEGDE